jgi:hypothetical protein
MKRIFLLILLFLIISCQSHQNSHYEFDPRALVDNKISLAEIADDIMYIPLDNHYLLSYIYHPILTNNSIFLKTRDGLIAFNRNGEMARKIGNKGRGPGEYQYGNNFTVDNNKETVYVKDRDKKIKVYSRNGDFLRSIFLQEYAGEIEEIGFFDSQLFVFYYLQFGDAMYNWVILDTLGNVIKKKERTIPTFISGYDAGSGIYKFENNFFYWNSYNDTVYSIFADLSCKTSFLLRPGEHRLPKSNFDPSKNPSLYMSLSYIFETDHFLVCKYYYKKITIALIDKKSKKSFLTFLEREKNSADGNYVGGILNNLDGGIDFQPDSYFAENNYEYLIGSINPYEIKLHVSGNKFKNSNPKYPEKKKELEKLANSLKETDNPVLVLVRLKK